ncbi:MAG: hypothetical protein H7A43_05810 [Verrucomicrobia bacterium]|nr:hypothetical protein [Kiritimatiellia bacterium]MCP5488147.1 hypothetical protein [Verrucomicrobiota bacterium]
MKAVLFALAALVFSTTLVRAQEEEEGWTKEKYIKTMLEWSKKDPKWNPTRESLEANFNERDVDGDGRLTTTERKAKVKSQYIRQQMQWAAKDPSWNPTEESLSAKFDELDTNHDGLLSEEEQASGKKK